MIREAEHGDPEPAGGIPLTSSLVNANHALEAGAISEAELQAAYDPALRDTVQRLEAAGSPVLADGKQEKHSFHTYPLHGLKKNCGRWDATLFAEGATHSSVDGGLQYPAQRFSGGARRYTRLPLKSAPGQLFYEHQFAFVSQLKVAPVRDF